jgi:1,2-phenylacetyl-CoA epoxidase catalytic subunit
MFVTAPTSRDFAGPVFRNYRKGVASTHWSHAIRFETESKLPDWKRELAVAIATQACHAEHLGLCTASMLVLEAPTAEIRYAFASAAHDEATHSEILGRFAVACGGVLQEPNDHHAAMVLPLLDDELTYAERATLHCFLEGFALDQFKTFVIAFEGDALGDIYSWIRKDEARHVALGMLALDHTLRPRQRRQRFDLARIDEMSRKLGNVNNDLFDWLATIEKKPKAVIRHRYIRNHAKRIKEIRQLMQGAD